MGYAGTRVPKMAKCSFWVPTSPELATFLRSQNPNEGDAAHMATFSYRHNGL